MIRRLSIVIVEDEPHAARRLEMALRQAGPMAVEAVARDGRSGLEAIRLLKPDVAFLDISLPLMSGLEVAAALVGDTPPVLIFVTAYDQFAVEAFRLAATDYLLKPVEFDQVSAALDRARRRLEADGAGERVQRLEALIATLNGRSPAREAAPEILTEIWAPGRRGAVRVPITEVEWFESERDYIRVHTPAGDHLIRETLQTLHSRLDPGLFLRIHRSSIVNLQRLGRVERRPSGALQIVLQSGRKVDVGRSYQTAVRDLFTRPGRAVAGAATS